MNVYIVSYYAFYSSSIILAVFEFEDEAVRFASQYVLDGQEGVDVEKWTIGAKESGGVIYYRREYE